MKAEDVKKIVREKYGTIASQSTVLNQNGCCGPSACCGKLEFSMIGDEYTTVKGHVREADLGLGCGLPTEYAGINIGDSVLDLGSGAGNDCFVARSIVGESGKVTGLDLTEEMIGKARANLAKTGFTNLEFILGDIENMPLPDNTFDVVISNCVLNLVPNKQQAFSEIFRVLKPGGHFCISDVVFAGDLPEKIKQEAEMYAGCVAGAAQETDYLQTIQNIGFTNVQVHKRKPIVIPDAVLQKYLSDKEVAKLKSAGAGIFSLTLSAIKQ
ncbi:MAG: arsenite methyltransferase [Draconibacterium sp.]